MSGCLATFVPAIQPWTEEGLLAQVGSAPVHATGRWAAELVWAPDVNTDGGTVTKAQSVGRAGSAIEAVPGAFIVARVLLQLVLHLRLGQAAQCECGACHATLSTKSVLCGRRAWSAFCTERVRRLWVLVLLPSIALYTAWMPRVKEGATGAIVIDDRYSPLIVSTFIGVVDLPLGQWFEQENVRMVQREHARGRRIIHVHDTSNIEKTPPEMRKFWAEMSSRNETMLELCVIETPLVITSTLMRGVMTAVGWLNPKVAKLNAYSTVEQAIRACVVRLAGEGIKLDLPFKSYELPPEAVHVLKRAG
ncbi:MAG TPA: hypothetical protein VN764_05450 [Polyangiaceae bacterium]|nr:hypothetical protein [Polyangiaceae bacterium]